MRLPLVAVFADEAGQMQVARLKLLAGFLARLATGAGVGRFAVVRVQLAAARTPETAIRLLRAFEQEDFLALVEAVEQGGDFVRQLHARSETGAVGAGKPSGAFRPAKSVLPLGGSFLLPIASNQT